MYVVTVLNFYLWSNESPEGPVLISPTALDYPAVLPADFNILQALRSFPKCTAAGHSGVWIQHLIDVSSAPLATPFLSTPKHLVNHLAAGNAPKEVSHFVADATLVALPKLKPNCAPDVHPIAVGEVLKRLTGKCLCHLLKNKAMVYLSQWSRESDTHCEAMHRQPLISAMLST